MSRFYSPSAAGFFDPDIHGKAMPADAVPVSEDDFAALMAGQAEGLEIIAGPDGAPRLAPPAPPTVEEILASLRRKRDQLLRESDFTQIPDAPLSAGERTAWAAYRQALRDLPEHYADDPASVVWPTPPNMETPDAA